MRVTNKVDVFHRWVRPGDVIAFDTLKSLSGLVQWADNAPVNHVAVMIDDVHCAMANKPGKGVPSPSAITTPPLKTLLDAEKIRAAQILRPRRLTPARLERLLEAIAGFEAEKTDFSVGHMFALAPTSVIRAYAELDAPDDHTSVLLKRMVRALQRAALAGLKNVRNDARTLTCSEFVYRSFCRAGIKLEIVEPLAGLPADHPWDEDITRSDEKYWRRVRRHNDRAGTPPEEDFGVQPETVTPGDLWRSPTLDPVGYVVKTPPR